MRWTVTIALALAACAGKTDDDSPAAPPAADPCVMTTTAAAACAAAGAPTAWAVASACEGKPKRATDGGSLETRADGRECCARHGDALCCAEACSCGDRCGVGLGP